MTTWRSWLFALHIAALTYVSCLGQTTRTSTTDAKHGAWTSAPALIHARASHAVVATRDAIYALAGTGGDSGAPVLSVERFDGTAWREETRLPGQGLNAPAAVALKGKIYLIGGFETVTNVPTSEVHVYDTKTKRWSKVAKLPAPRGGHAAAVMHGLIHVVGGGNSQSTLADHSVYDPATDRWIERAPLPHAEGSPAAVVVGRKLHVIGGRSGPRDFGAMFEYEAASDAWSTGPPVDPRATCGAIVFHNSIYLFGGESQLKVRVLADALRLRKGITTWETIPSIPTARSFARAVLFKGSVYVVGGSLEPQSNHAPRGTAIVERLKLKNF